MKKLIIDVDTGVDDAHALLLALADADTEILAITCVNGNTTLKNVLVNTLRVLKICKRLDVPVYRGANCTLMGGPSPETGFHGSDGLGDTETDEVDLDLVKTTPAFVAMVEIVNKYPGEVVLVALAPLTNVALALRYDENFGRKLKECCIMGGNTTGLGNFKICGEFNFACDPEAAKCVLEELKCPILLVSLEPCYNHGLPMEWYNNWASVDSEIGRFNKRIIATVLKNMLARGRTTMAMYDANAIAFVLNPAAVKRVENHYCTIETGGEFSRGMMVVDWRNHLGRKANVKLVMEMDINLVAEMMGAAVDRHV